MSQTSQSTEFKAAPTAAGFTGDLIIPGDAEYDSSVTRFAKNAKRNAALVAFVKSAEDVSKVIQFVNTYSSAHGSPVHMAVRGGGHSTSGSSSSEGGVIIDLSRYVNTVRVDEKEKLGYVGGGATWAAVDQEAIKYGLATTGGTVNHTGVGG
jgi:FAD/FMN-containing dehydrogenase